MANSDLRARPLFHHKRASIEARLTTVFAALAIGRDLEKRDPASPPAASSASSARCATPGPAAAAILDALSATENAHRFGTSQRCRALSRRGWDESRELLRQV